MRASTALPLVGSSCGMWINRSKSLKSIKVFTNVERKDEQCKKEVVRLFQC